MKTEKLGPSWYRVTGTVGDDELTTFDSDRALAQKKFKDLVNKKLAEKTKAA